MYTLPETRPLIPAIIKAVGLKIEGLYYYLSTGIRTPECAFGGENCQWQFERNLPMKAMLSIVKFRGRGT